MVEHKELGELFKNIQKSVSLFGLNETNRFLDDIVSSKREGSDLIEYIINCVCIEYNVSRTILMRSNSRGEIADAKKLTFVLLHNIIGLSIRHISKRIFLHPNHMVGHRALRDFRRLDVRIKQHKELLDRYNRLEQQIQNKIAELQNQKQQ